MLMGLTCLCKTVLIGQNNEEWSNIAKQYLQDHQFEEVIRFVDSLAGLSPSIDEHIIAELWNHKGNALKGLGKYEQAINAHQKALAIRLDKYGQQSIAAAKSYHNIGNCLLLSGQYIEAVAKLKKAISIAINQQNTLDLDVAAVYSSLAYAYQNINNIGEAKKYNYEALDWKKEEFGEHHPKLIPVLINLAHFLFDLKEYEQAKSFYTEALAIQLACIAIQHPITAQLYTSLGNCFLELKDTKTALHYQSKALAIYIAFDENDYINPQELASCYQNTGSVYMVLNDVKQALLYFNKAYATLPIVTTIQHLPLLNNIALCHQQIGEYEQALIFYDKITNFANAENQPTLFLSNVQENIGSCLQSLGAYEEAKRSFQEALTYYSTQAEFEKQYFICLSKMADCELKQKHYTESEQMYQTVVRYFSDSPSYMREWHRFKLGDCFQQQKKYRQALTYYDLALQEAQNLPTELQIALLIAKSETLMSLSEDEISLHEALQQLQQAEQKMKIYRNAIHYQTSKIYLNDRFAVLYDRLVAVCYELGKYDELFYEQAYQYAEASKARVLKDLLYEREIKNSTIIPEKLLLRERQLMKNLVSIEEAIIGQGDFLDREKEALRSKYQQQFELTNQLKNVRDTISFYLQEKTNAFSLEELQNILTTDQSLLHYYLTAESELFIFVVNKNEWHHRKIKPSDNFRSNLIEYYNCLKKRPDMRSDKSEADELYTTLAYEFYQLLVAPVKDYLLEEVIIIPDKLLVFLPFETLLQQPAQTARLYQKHDYLIKNHQFSYCYSTLLLHQFKQNESADYRNNVLAIAPEFKGRDKLTYNTSEARQVAKWLRGDKIIGENAMKDLFITKDLSQYRVIHFSTHGVADETHPNYSYLSFAAVQDTLGSDKLYATEIQQLSLSADLIFLSACETNIGKFYRGEGFISLSRAFTIGGAKSVIASLWKIDDRQTEQIVKQTYKNLKMGASKSEALAAAKNDYLKNCRNHEKAHPYYWSALLLIGDEKSIDFNQTNDVFLSVLALLLILMLIAVLIKRKSKIQFPKS